MVKKCHLLLCNYSPPLPQNPGSAIILAPREAATAAPAWTTWTFYHRNLQGSEEEKLQKKLLKGHRQWQKRGRGVDGKMDALCKTKAWAHAALTGYNVLEVQSHAVAERCNYSSYSCHYFSYLQ